MLPLLSAKQPQGVQPGLIPSAGCVFYLLVQWDEVSVAVLGTVCISICLQFLLGLCVPVLGCHRDFPKSEVLVISESRSLFPSVEFPELLITLSLPQSG